MMENSSFKTHNMEHQNKFYRLFETNIHELNLSHPKE